MSSKMCRCTIESKFLHVFYQYCVLRVVVASVLDTEFRIEGHRVTEV